MNEENKYFTPDIEDLRIGYECEICTNHGYESFNEGKEIWEKVIIGYKDENGGYKHELTDIIIGIDDGYQPVRVSYLTKEQIEAEGWQMYGKSVDMWFKFKESPITHTNIQEFYMYKPYNLFMNYGTHDNKLIIKCDFLGGQDFSKSDTLFEGECKGINDFRYICKLLKINQNTNEKE